MDLDARPAGEIVIRYEYRAGLVRLGIIHVIIRGRTCWTDATCEGFRAEVLSAALGGNERVAGRDACEPHAGCVRSGCVRSLTAFEV